MNTLADVIVPIDTPAAKVAEVAVMSLFIALCAQISILLPISPVPLTGSTLGVLYAGALLGSKRGAAAVALYLLEGAIGLPFFAGGAHGTSVFFGHTGGYLLGFLPAAWAAGALAERGWDRTPFKAFAMMLLGSSFIFAGGLLVLSRFAPEGKLLAWGLYPFIAGDIAKSCLSAALLPLGWKLLGQNRA